MKIVARIRQLLSAKEATVARVVERVPLSIAGPPEQPLHRAVERSASTQPSPLAPVASKKGSFRLEGEGIATPFADPSEDIIRRELERLRSSGPSILAVMAPDGSYLQAAGNAKRMTVEGHFESAQRTTHVVLSQAGPLGPAATVVATCGPIEVCTSEVWAAPEVTNLFSSFVTTGTITADLSRRDISMEISGPQPKRRR